LRDERYEDDGVEHCPQNERQRREEGRAMATTRWRMLSSILPMVR
jgi:hypothetical protein